MMRLFFGYFAHDGPLQLEFTQLQGRIIDSGKGWHTLRIDFLLMFQDHGCCYLVL